ncbi:MAG: hypothetical protein P1P82_10390 [Bacteroidales bacterium]|nr:hypothetical protein [Bacteroidales bacterium]MDT8430976.1 hypothetical protein [Bacteroidales bacterium]
MKKITVLFLIMINPVILPGQKVQALQSLNEGDFPELHWYSLSAPAAADFQVFRKAMKEAEFREIHTLRMTSIRSDTLVYRVIDTTLVEKAMYQYYLRFSLAEDTLLLSESLYAHNLGNIPAPTVVSFRTESATDRKAILLNWKLNYDFTVKSLALFRSRDYEDGYELIAHLPPDATTYADLVDISNEAYFYFIQVRDFFGYQVPGVRVHGICTYAEKPYPPQDFSATEEDGIVRLNWRNVGNNVIATRIFRKIGNAGVFYPLEGSIYSSEKYGEYADTALSRFSGEALSYYAVNISDGFLKSNTSDTVTISVYGDIHVAPPEELRCVQDSLQHVLLIWTSPETDPNINGFNVYRSVNGEASRKLNRVLLPYDMNYFTDTTAKNGTVYQYEVESVSITGNESASRTKTTCLGETEDYTILVTHTILTTGVALTWLPISMAGMREIRIYRQALNEKPVLLKKLSAEQTTFTDLKVLPGKSYTYILTAGMENGEERVLNQGVLVNYLK